MPPRDEGNRAIDDTVQTASIGLATCRGREPPINAVNQKGYANDERSPADITVVLDCLYIKHIKFAFAPNCGAALRMSQRSEFEGRTASDCSVSSV
jgi:hypothetical protein